MRSYLIDEIVPSDMEKIDEYLRERAIPSNIKGIFWVEMPEERLTRLQSDHKGCRPHVFAVELGDNWVKMEFLIRNLKHMRCNCGGYCTTYQREYIMEFADNMLRSLNIKT